MPYMVVFAGAGLGGALRHGVNQIAAHLFGFAFPYGTFIVNVLGSLAMGLLAEYFALRGGLPQELRLLLTTGVLGGFTTFSTFSLDTVTMWERGQGSVAMAYAVLSLALSVGALIAGLAIVRVFLSGTNL
ncbi:MAG TPA: fluoride efflux transporter CrcB [Rhizobium sp.]|nr:fluoride efflux transporter CrcB [Rhizobium sp.]